MNKKYSCLIVFIIIVCFIFLIPFLLLMPEKKTIYEIRHNNDKIIIQEVLTNATSANYIQILKDNQIIKNYREDRMELNEVICKDSIIVIKTIRKDIDLGNYNNTSIIQDTIFWSKIVNN